MTVSEPLTEPTVTGLLLGSVHNPSAAESLPYTTAALTAYLLLHASSPQKSPTTARALLTHANITTDFISAAAVGKTFTEILIHNLMLVQKINTENYTHACMHIYI